MMLEGYTMEIFRPGCNSEFESVHCHAHLDQDISRVLPYLNTALGGHHYQEDPPALTFKLHGKLLTLHPRLVAVNALADEQEAHRILEWLKQQINETWERRHEIQPSTSVPRPPRPLDLLRLLPRTNCGQCGVPTCMVFALGLAEGGRDPAQCPPLERPQREELQRILASSGL